jgi:hypothetical protein
VAECKRVSGKILVHPDLIWRLPLLQVNAKGLNKFNESYSEVLRANIDNLKKKERRKKTKMATSD